MMIRTRVAIKGEGGVVTARLKLVEGGRGAYQHPDVVELFDQSFTVGRDPDCEIVWTMQEFGRHHAKLEYSDFQWQIHALNDNKVFVNGNPISKEPQKLKNNDLIGFTSLERVRYKFLRASSPTTAVFKTTVTPAPQLAIMGSTFDESNALAVVAVAGSSSSASSNAQTQTEPEPTSAISVSAIESNELVTLMEDELMCAICSEVMINATIIDCGHSFCKFCIDRCVIKYKFAKCPVCRTPFVTRSRNVVVDNLVTKAYETLPVELQQHRHDLIQGRQGEVEEANNIPLEVEEVEAEEESASDYDGSDSEVEGEGHIHLYEFDEIDNEFDMIAADLVADLAEHADHHH